ncbi:DUF1810 domain-containing protein [Mycobacterium sp. MS1601]|uniref:DUF1810 domain-containing protein n=1 Tax=Mycobacterium sp. MS1601 TaxID=1936029 RepID=UPI0009F97A2F|nr:DUF1810 domain-containing protein [Mycobacterium sp. MS1601]
MSDPFQLQRFIDAQDPVYATVLAELRAGRKRTHWMWFVFPQLRTLGHSPTARHFGISDVAEARAYLAHPVLGPRLRECCRLAAAIEGRTAEQVFGFPDNLKLRSSATLFALCGDDAGDFNAVLDRFYDGQPDPETLRTALP